MYVYMCVCMYVCTYLCVYVLQYKWVHNTLKYIIMYHGFIDYLVELKSHEHCGSVCILHSATGKEKLQFCLQQKK